MKKKIVNCPVKTATFTKADVEQVIVNELKLMVSMYEEHRAKTIKQLQEGTALAYEIKWSKEVLIYEFMADWARNFIAFEPTNELSFIDVLREETHRKTQQLINNDLRATSTSPLSNAVEDAEREATSRFVRYATGWLKRYDTAPEVE